MTEFGIVLDHENEGIAILADFEGKFRGQVFEGNAVAIHTSVSTTRSSLVFFQKMVRCDAIVADFICTVAVIDDRGKPRKLPTRITELIDQGNTRLIEDKAS